MIHYAAPGPTERTGGVQTQEFGAQGFPLTRVTALAAVWPPGIVAAASGARAFNLARAAVA